MTIPAGHSTYRAFAAASDTTPARLEAVTGAGASQGFIVKALSTNSASVFLGPSDVTTSTGLELEPGEWQPFPGAYPSDLYVVSAAAQEVRVIVL